MDRLEYESRRNLTGAELSLRAVNKIKKLSELCLRVVPFDGKAYHGKCFQRLSTGFIKARLEHKCCVARMTMEASLLDRKLVLA